MTGDWGLGTRRLEDVDSRVVISSDSEKSLSFALRRAMFGPPKRENCQGNTDSAIESVFP